MTTGGLVYEKTCMWMLWQYIYYATILKDGIMSTNGRVELTDEAIDAVFQHIISMEKFSKEGFSGYDIPKKTGGKVCLCVFDKDKYELKKKK